MTCPDAERKHAPSRHILGIFLLILLTMTSRVALASDQPLLLEVLINGNTTDKIAEFTMRGGKLMAHPSELQDIGLKIPASLLPKRKSTQKIDNTVLIELSKIPGLKWRIDLASQQLYLTIDINQLTPTELLTAKRTASTDRRVVESGTGMTLNYDVVTNVAGGQAGASGSLEARAFSPWGVFSSQWLGYAGSSSGGTGTNTAVRLDSTYEYADVNSLRRYSLGDFVTSSLAWTRPVHLTGVQVRSDFTTRPDLVTFPLPSIKGSAAVPSTLDVLADGNQVLAQQIAPGPFEIPQLPVVMGAGTIALSVTNALGQQVTITKPFYASADMLAPKLQTYSVQAGVVRQRWGSISDQYGKPTGFAVYRRGLSSKFTIEGNLEGTSGAISAGAGGLVQVGNLGVVNFSTATSTGAGHAGEQFALGAQRIGRIFSVGATAIIATKGYTDVAALNGSPIPRKQVNANIGYTTKRFGTIGAAYGDLYQPGTEQPIDGSVATAAQRTRVLSANYSIQVHHIAFYANEFRSYTNSASSDGFQAGVTIPFGRRNSVNISATSDGSVQIQAQKSASTVGEWGYQTFLSAGSSNHEFGELQYKSPWDLISAGVDQTAGVTTFRVENQGAISFVDKGFFPSNTIFDSFAIVDTGPMKNVHVLQENREVGKTNSSGKLLVPDMRSFDLNHIAIVSTDIPMDATIDDASRTVRPRDLSGVVVKFPIKISHGALLHLVDEAGTPLPVGTVARLRTSGVLVPVGYDGDAYMQDLASHNDVDVMLPEGGHCTVSFNYLPVPGDIPVLGPLHCRGERP